MGLVWGSYLRQIDADTVVKILAVCGLGEPQKAKSAVEVFLQGVTNELRKGEPRIQQTG